MIDIKNMSLAELEAFLGGMGKEKYRAYQVFKWIYQLGAKNFDDMTNLSKSFREELKKEAFISQLELGEVEESADGTRKYLFMLSDGEAIESVLIPEGKRLTLCVSSQVGCPLDCGFCLTASIGFKRNLHTSEIINQILYVNGELGDDRKVTNIVFMGMGEPLLNYDNVIRAISIITGEESMRLSHRKVTVSTAGLVPQMARLGQDTKVNLAVSLNATTDDVRRKIMPVDKKYPLHELIEACRNYPLQKMRRITFEYVMLSGINDSLDDARRIVKLLMNIPSKVNLLPFNEYEGALYKRPSKDVVERFHRFLLDKGITAITRSSKGSDISAACGQLRGKGDAER